MSSPQFEKALQDVRDSWKLHKEDQRRWTSEVVQEGTRSYFIRVPRCQSENSDDNATRQCTLKMGHVGFHRSVGMIWQSNVEDPFYPVDLLLARCLKSRWKTFWAWGSW